MSAESEGSAWDAACPGLPALREPYERNGRKGSSFGGLEDDLFAGDRVPATVLVAEIEEGLRLSH